MCKEVAEKKKIDMKMDVEKIEVKMDNTAAKTAQRWSFCGASQSVTCLLRIKLTV